MPESVVNALVNAGILGPILIAAGWYVLHLQRKLSESQEKRVEDAQKVAVQLLELNDQWAGVVAEQVAAQEEQKRLVEGVRNLLGDVKGALQSRPGYPVPAAPRGSRGGTTE